MSASSTATLKRMDEAAWPRAVRIRTRAQAQSAAAMCPQDRGVPLRGWATMLLLMLMSAGAAVAASYAHVCRAMWFVGRTD